MPAADPPDTKANESRSITQAGVPGAALASGGEVGAALGTALVVALVGEVVGDGEAVGVAEPPSGTGEPHKDTRTTMAGVIAMNGRTTD